MLCTICRAHLHPFLIKWLLLVGFSCFNNNIITIHFTHSPTHSVCHSLIHSCTLLHSLIRPHSYLAWWLMNVLMFGLEYSVRVNQVYHLFITISATNSSLFDDDEVMINFNILYHFIASWMKYLVMNFILLHLLFIIIINVDQL